MNLLLANLWMPSGADLRLFGPELILVGTLAAMLVLPLIFGRRTYLPALVTLVGTLLAALATASVAVRVVSGGEGGLTPAGTTPMLIADRFTVFFHMLIFMLLVLVTWLWIVGTVQREVGQSPRGPAPDVGSSSMTSGTPEFFVLLVTSALGMLLMVSTLNLLVLIIAMETASLPSYAIVASDKRSRLGAEAALKYVTFGAAAAAIMVYGISLLYGQFGTLDVPTMVAQLSRTGGAVAAGPVFWLALAALGAGILFKIAAVPMHLWCPDVFEGAPTEITTWLSIASKAAGLGVLLRLVVAFCAAPGLAPIGEPLTWAVGLVAAITCTVGNLAALRQESVKRTLAYSSIAHAGYMMMAAAIFVGPESFRTVDVHAGLAAVVAYLFVYMIMNVGAFGVAAMVGWQTGTDHLSAFTGLGRRAPALALPMAICLFSLVGLPPLGGFAAKWYLILALGKTASTQPWLWGLIVVAVVNTAIRLSYYVRIIRQMYLRDDAALGRGRAPLGGLAIVNACAVALLVLGTIGFNRLGHQAEALSSNLFDTTSAQVVQTPGDATASVGR